ncbi:hypothetical protein [Cellulomonas aerilata]|uniref:EccD-like transmembrane domain-containing protein n=1 Tax=Cellulomonas aerilata TaxID=515326 RepID=A0A512DFH7_9CELL|nr:hypothetical protein [Cellulomonas aerilata]GEO35238.1 hypothetical protein CAE01nite_29630 [Cellulomonas aerilata]
MTDDAGTELRRFSVMGAGRVRDVVVDPRARLGDVLDQLGLPTTTEALSPGGQRLRRTAVLTGAGIPDGAVLVAVDAGGLAPSRVQPSGPLSAAHAPGSRTTGQVVAGATTAAVPAPVPVPVPLPGGATTRSGTAHRGTEGSAWRGARTAATSAPAATRTSWFAPVTGLGLTALTAATVLLPGAASDGAVPGAVLLLAALAASWAGRGVRVRLSAAVGAGVGAGLLLLGLVPGLPTGAGHLAVAAGGLGAAVSAVVGRSGTPLLRRLAATTVVVGLTVTATAVLALVASWPVTVVAVGAVAVAVPLARVLPDVVVDVDTAALVDLDRLSTTAWSPRPRRAHPRWRPIRRDDVVGQVRDAVRHQRVVLAGVLAGVCVSSAALVAASPGSALATTLLLGTAGTGLALVARRYQDRTDRWLLRWSGLAAVAAAAVVLAGRVPGGVGAAVGVGLAAVTVALVLLAPVVGRGWTSLGLGRLADVLEALCVAGALPLAVWAAALVPWIRGLVT